EPKSPPNPRKLRLSPKSFLHEEANRNVKAASHHWRPNTVLRRALRSKAVHRERTSTPWGSLSPGTRPALQSHRLQMYYRHGFEEDTWQCETDFRVEILWLGPRVWRLPRRSWPLTIRQTCPSSPSASKRRSRRPARSRTIWRSSPR